MKEFDPSGRKQHTAATVPPEPVDVASVPPQPGLRINLFFSGPFPVPVPTSWSTTLPPDHELELQQLGSMVFGPRWRSFTGTLVLEQRSRLQRIGGPIYWVPGARLDPCVRCVRVGDGTTVGEAGWKVLGGEMWLLVRYVPGAWKREEMVCERMSEEVVCAGEVENVLGSVETVAGGRGNNSGAHDAQTSAVRGLRSLKRRRTLEIEDPEMEETVMAPEEEVALDIRGSHALSARVLRSSQRRRKE